MGALSRFARSSVCCLLISRLFWIFSALSLSEVGLITISIQYNMHVPFCESCCRIVCIMSCWGVSSWGLLVGNLNFPDNKSLALVDLFLRDSRLSPGNADDTFGLDEVGLITIVFTVSGVLVTSSSDEESRFLSS